MTAEIIDQANELAQQRIDMAIAAHRIDRNAVSAEHCAECGMRRERETLRIEEIAVHQKPDPAAPR